MKALYIPMTVLVLVAGLVAPATAADKMDHAAHAHGAEVQLAEGLVKKVDKAGGRLTVAHGPLPNGMPAMTMAFRLKEAAWFDKVKEGQKIRFATEDVGGAMTIIRLEPAQKI